MNVTPVLILISALIFDYQKISTAGHAR